MAMYIMESEYSLQTPDEFVHCSKAANSVKTYPLDLQINSVGKNEIRVRLEI